MTSALIGLSLNVAAYASETLRAPLSLLWIKTKEKLPQVLELRDFRQCF
jgi:hypothetical protein